MGHFDKLVNVLFIIIVFIVTRQVPFSFLSPIMNLSVIAILGLSISYNKFDKYTYTLICFLLVLPLLGSLFYSVVLTDNSYLLALKFFMVLLSVGLAYFVRVGKYALRWFTALCLLQSLILVLIYLYLLLFMDMRSYLPVRFLFLEKGWGDVYTYNGFFYRIQIKGSALLLIAFILNIEVKLFRYQYLVAFMLLIGVILAGNFAFLISLFLYVVYKVFSIQQVKTVNLYFLRLIFIVVIATIAMPYMVQYAASVIEMKKDSSLDVRSDQVEQLLLNLNETPFSALLGQGLGNTLEVKTPYRDYTGDTYFEVQTVYVINQLGMLFSLVFLVYNVLISLKLWGKRSIKVYFIYLVYISYAVTNPYIFDTNHVVLIIVLNSMHVILNKKNEYQQGHSGSCTLPA